jgi:hypothetical protein
MLLSDVRTVNIFCRYFNLLSLFFMKLALLQAWESWNQHKIEDLLDSAVAQPAPELLPKLQRCLLVGLLCVQQWPDDRPTMSAVVTMLNSSSSSDICSPKRPVPDSRTRPLLRQAGLATEEEAWDS